MSALRLAPLFIALITVGATCNNKDETGGAPSASAAPLVEIEGIKTDSLTPREHQIWSGLVKELVSPCESVAVPVAQCLQEKRDCDLCKPAAELVLRAVQAGRGKGEVAELYAMRFDPKRVKTIVIGESPSKGGKDPAIIMVEFADFECPACIAVHPFLEDIYKKYGKEMQMVFKHFPLDTHPNAKIAAQAAYAAQQQGHFWKMHKLLFESRGRLTEPDLVKYAEEIGLDLNKFKKDLHAPEAKERVKQEKKQGESLGVTGTPTIYINGRELDFMKLPNVETEVERWIKLEIERDKKRREKKSAPAPSASTQPASGG